jgi:hypothetical protein
MVLGMAATRVFSFIVYQASPRDPVVLVGTILVMMLLGLAATGLRRCRHWVSIRRN